jgi:hypothetical protein
MSVEQIEQSLLKLNSEERRNFAEWFFEHEMEFLGENDIDPEVQAMILERRKEAEEHPELMENWDKAMEDVRRRFDELRAKRS